MKATDSTSSVGRMSATGFELEAGERYIALMRWEDSWPIATKDLDIQLEYEGPFRIGARSFRSYLGPLSPLEFLFFRAPVKGTYCMKINIESEVVPDWVQIQSFIGPDLEHHTLTGSVDSPAESNSPGLIAVGATEWDDTNEIWRDSGRGPTPDGRIKPEMVAGPAVDSAILQSWYEHRRRRRR